MEPFTEIGGGASVGGRGRRRAPVGLAVSASRAIVGGARNPRRSPRHRPERVLAREGEPGGARRAGGDRGILTEAVEDVTERSDRRETRRREGHGRAVAGSDVARSSRDPGDTRSVAGHLEVAPAGGVEVGRGSSCVRASDAQRDVLPLCVGQHDFDARGSRSGGRDERHSGRDAVGAVGSHEGVCEGEVAGREGDVR